MAFCLSHKCKYALTRVKGTHTHARTPAHLFPAKHSRYPSSFAPINTQTVLVAWMDCGISTIVKLYETIFFVFNNSPKDNVGIFPCAYTFPGSTHVFQLANLWLISESIWSWEPIKAQSEMPFYCFTWVVVVVAYDCYCVRLDYVCTKCYAYAFHSCPLFVQ